MKFIRFYAQLLHFVIRHFFLKRIMTFIQYGIDTQSCTGLGRTDEIHNYQLPDSLLKVLLSS